MKTPSASLTILRRDGWFVVFILVLALALRIDFLWAGNSIIDADEAIVGLMAKHILEGKNFPTFYYGQHYMGSFEAILASVSFAIFGISGLSLKLVPLTFSIILVAVSYLIGSQIGNRWSARLSALFIAVPPTPLVIWSAKARGGFIETLVIGALALFFTIRWLKSPDERFKSTFVIGLLLGFGWWVNNQIVYFIGPIALWMALALLQKPHLVKSLFQHVVLGTFAFIFGGLPFWIYNIYHHFESFKMFGSSNTSEIFSHFKGLWIQALPIILGSMRFWQNDEVFSGSVATTWVLYGTLTFLLVIFRRHQIYQTFRAHVDVHCPIELLTFFIIFSCAVFVLSSFGWLVQAPRYLLPLYVALAPLFGRVVSRVLEDSRSMGALLVCATLCINLSSSYWNGRAIPGEPFVFETNRVSRDHSELLTWLSDHHVKFVRTNYWIGYRLAFETKENVRFGVFGEPRTSRIDEYDREADAAPDNLVPYILVSGEAPLVKHALETLHYKFNESQASGYTILFDITRHEPPIHLLSPQEYELSASLHSQDLKNVSDDNLETRWGTGVHQSPGQLVTVTFKHPIKLYKVKLKLGAFLHDFPRGLKMTATTLNNKDELILSESDYEAIEYFDECRASLEVVLPSEVPVTSVTMEQRGEHPILDWSIAELELYERESDARP